MLWQPLSATMSANGVRFQRRRIVHRVAPKLPKRDRVRHTPSNSAFGIDSLEVPDQKQTEVDPLIHRKVRRFLFERQRACDPLGFRVWEVMRAAVRHAVTARLAGHLGKLREIGWMSCAFKDVADPPKRAAPDGALPATGDLLAIGLPATLGVEWLVLDGDSRTTHRDQSSCVWLAPVTSLPAGYASAGYATADTLSVDWISVSLSASDEELPTVRLFGLTAEEAVPLEVFELRVRTAG